MSILLFESARSVNNSLNLLKVESNSEPDLHLLNIKRSLQPKQTQFHEQHRHTLDEIDELYGAWAEVEGSRFKVVHGYILELF